VTRILTVPWPDARLFARRNGAPVRLLAVSDEVDPALEHAGNRDAIGRLDAIVGHSFGGKVALAARERGAVAGLERVFVVDSDPAAVAPSGEGWRMFETISALPKTFASREEGTRKYVCLRRADLDRRFPGLIDSVLGAASAA